MATHQIPCTKFSKNKVLGGSFKLVAGETDLAPPTLIPSKSAYPPVYNSDGPHPSQCFSSKWASNNQISDGMPWSKNKKLRSGIRTLILGSDI
jgi:hypothetical protein